MASLASAIRSCISVINLVWYMNYHNLLNSTNQAKNRYSAFVRSLENSCFCTNWTRLSSVKYIVKATASKQTPPVAM